MTKAFELFEKCRNCKLKECIGCEITYSDICAIRDTDQWYIEKIRELEEKTNYHNQLDLDDIYKKYIFKGKLETWLQRFKNIKQDLETINGTDCELYTKLKYNIELLEKLLED